MKMSPSAIILCTVIVAFGKMCIVYEFLNVFFPSGDSCSAPARLQTLASYSIILKYRFSLTITMISPPLCVTQMSITNQISIDDVTKMSD